MKTCPKHNVCTKKKLNSRNDSDNFFVILYVENSFYSTRQFKIKINLNCKRIYKEVINLAKAKAMCKHLL